MADVTKLVGNDAPFGQRYQVFTEADAGTDDSIRVAASLRGRPASKISISNGSATLGVRFNVYHTIYPARSPSAGFSEYGERWIASGLEVMESGLSSQYVLEANEDLTLDNDFLVSDILITTATADFKILVS